MKHFFGFFFLTILLGASGVSALSCAFTFISLDTLSPGVVEVKICGDTTCTNVWSIDTVSESQLLDDLEKNFHQKANAIYGHVAEVNRISTGDSLLFIEFPDSVLVVFDSILKGEITRDSIWYRVVVGQWGENDFRSLIGKTFLSFHDSTTEITDLGFSSPGLCQFTPNGFFLEEGKIRKTGTGEFPGVSVSLAAIMTRVTETYRISATGFECVTVPCNYFETTSLSDGSSRFVAALGGNVNLPSVIPDSGILVTGYFDFDSLPFWVRPGSVFVVTGLVLGNIGVQNISSQKAKSGIRISPNPFTRFAEIQAFGGSGILRIFDLAGRKVSGWRLRKNETIVWDASHFAAGTYFLTLHKNGRVHTRKMLLKR